MNPVSNKHLSNYLNSNAIAMNKINQKEIFDLQNLIWETIFNDKVIFTAGNGGSYSTASHAVCDFGKGINAKINKKLRISCLLDSLPILTAWANDYSYKLALGNLLSHQQRPGDVLLLISGSGNSENLIYAAETAKKVNNKVVSLVGFDGGALKQISDYVVHIPSHDMQIVENLHLMIVHYIFQSSTQMSIERELQNQ
jgi:D-sedoheptulose 7-phosphate isomerase